MATYTQTTILTQGDNAVPANGTPGHDRMFTDSTGRLWYGAFYGDGGGTAGDWREVRAYYSDDGGSSWSHEVVVDHTTMGGSINEDAWSIAFAEANNGDIVVYGYWEAGSWTSDNINIFRRTAVNTWAQQGIIFPLASNTEDVTVWNNMRLFNHPDDDDYWICILADRAGTGNPDLTYHLSTDNLATFTRTVASTTSPTGANTALYERGGMCVATEDSFRTIHIFWNTHFSGSNNTYVTYTKITGWDASISVTTQLNLTAAGTPSRANYAGAWLSDGTTFRLIWHKFDGGTDHDMKWVDVTWSGGVPSFGTIQTGQDIGSDNLAGAQAAYVDHTDDKHVILRAYNSTTDRVERDNETAADEDADSGWTTLGETISMPHDGLDVHRSGVTGPKTGVGFMVYGNESGSARTTQWIKSSDFSQWLTPAIAPKVVTHALTFAQEVSPNSQFEYEASATLTKPSYGGRATIRINSRVWMLATTSDSSATHALYSDDGGMTWVSETISSFAADAFAIHRDGNAEPWAVLHKPGQSKLQIYQRTTGGSWTLRTTVSTSNTSNCESFDIAYDGTAYHLVYGYVHTSSSRRRVGHRTTTASDLTGWSSVTVIDNGDTSGRGPARDRAIGMMMDTNLDIHVCFTQVKSNRFVLKYSKYDESAGTWSSAEDVIDLGADSNNDRRAKWVSVATDENDVPHVTFSYTPSANSTPQAHYSNRVGGSWLTPEKLTGTLSEATQYSSAQGTSLGFNHGEVPVAILDASLDGSGGRLVIASRSIAGSWSFTDLDLSTGIGQHRPDTLYQARYDVSRTVLGAFIEVQGSITAVVSTDLLWDDETTPGGADATFSQTIGLQGFAYPQNEAEFSQVVGVNRGYPKTVTTGASFGSVVSDPTHDYARTVETPVEFGSCIGYTFDPASGDDEHNWEVKHRPTFSQQIDLLIEKIQRVEHTLTFEDSILQTHPRTVEHDIEFEDSILDQGDRNRLSSGGVSVGQEILLQKTLNLGVTHSISFGTSGLVVRDWSAISDHFDPGWTATLEDDVGQVRFLYPYDLPTQSLTMKKPEFGDVRSDFRRKGSVHRNRSGAARTFKVPVYSRFSISFNGLLRKRAEEFRTFIVAWMGENVRYEDHNGVQHKVIIVDQDLRRSQTGPEYVNVVVTLEKAGRIDLAPTVAQ